MILVGRSGSAAVGTKSKEGRGGALVGSISPRDSQEILRFEALWLDHVKGTRRTYRPEATVQIGIKRNRLLEPTAQRFL